MNNIRIKNQNKKISPLSLRGVGGIFWHKLKQARQTGETITEVMVSVTLLVGVLTAGFGVLKNAIDTNVDVRNRIIATNIAREGIEGVRNIRDTNWLKYSGEKLDKWLCNDTPEEINQCEGDISSNPDAILKERFYKLDFMTYDVSGETGTRYFLIADENTDFSARPLDLEIPATEVGNPTNYLNWLEYYRLWEKFDDKRFVHNDPLLTTLKATPFFRQIALIPEENNLCAPLYCNEKKLHVISRVQWKEGNAVQEVKLETYLYNYFKLDAYPE